VLSLFGNDAEVAAFHGAIVKGEYLRILFPEEEDLHVSFAKDAVCYRSAIQLPGMNTKVRHIVAMSANVIQNGMLGSVYCLSDKPGTVWNTLVHSLGLPAVPEWAGWIHNTLMRKERISPMKGKGLSSMVAINVTRDDMLRLIKLGVETNALLFPATNASVRFPKLDVCDAFDVVVPSSVDCDEKAA
jgi:hypothetical protein